jgi:uncharacterized membrane protein
MNRMPALSLLLFLVMFILFPLVFGELMVTALAKLHLSRESAALIFMAILFGGLVNIPVARLKREEPAIVHPLAVYGLPRVWPRLGRTTPDTIIAVNVGGALVPAGLVIYEAVHLGALGQSLLWATAGACVVNTFISYHLARPVPGLGIAMPGFVSPIVSALLALFIAPDNAAPIAFIVGVTGPLVGADLLHLDDIKKIGAGLASIGGAGTFDGIVLSGIVAAYLA